MFFVIPVIISMLSFAYAPRQDLDDRRNSAVSDMSIVSELEAGNNTKSVISELRPDIPQVNINVQAVVSAGSDQTAGTLVSQEQKAGTNLTKKIVDGGKVIEGLKQKAEEAEQALKDKSKSSGSGSPMCCRRRKEANKEMAV